MTMDRSRSPAARVVQPAWPGETRSPASAGSKPAIELPRGGGAIRGMGEAFSTQAATGTASMSVPVATSPGRSGFGPALALAYDSGHGNGPFGFGWALQLPAIERQTRKGLPRYEDAVESDTYALSGADDLVPVYRQDASGAFVLGADGRHVDHEDVIGLHRVRRYRPRVEGSFARIERWTRSDDAADVHWRAIDRDNVLSLYGLTAASRIADPLRPERIFRWLPCETRDTRGNAVLYRYKAEDGVNVDLSRVHEAHRGAATDVRRTARRYLKRILYGNRAPLLDADGQRPAFLDAAAVDQTVAAGDWMFELVVDYGEHATSTPDEVAGWRCRADAFSSHRGGFELRTTRLGHRFLMFHRIGEDGGVDAPVLVRSTDLTFTSDASATDPDSRIYTFLTGITQTGHGPSPTGPVSRSLPALTFRYSRPTVQDAVRDIGPDDLENLPEGVDGRRFNWIDLHGEGIQGLLTEQSGAWFYKRNLTPLQADLPGPPTVAFGPLERVASRPAPTRAGSGATFMDLAGDGVPDRVVALGDDPDAAVDGYFRHDDAEGWENYRPFRQRLNRGLHGPNARLIDLDGDGRADLLITEHEALVWHRSHGDEGFGPAQRLATPLDENDGPRIVFDDGTETIHLADMDGDGLVDLVRIRNGEICWWPNLGHGRFGAKVTMDDAPRLDHDDQYDPARVRLGDIDGSGTTDLIYLHRDGARIHFNLSGNGWSAARHLAVSPPVHADAHVDLVDLFGNGTACLVWSSPLEARGRHAMRYVDLMGGTKPHLMIGIDNHLGTVTRLAWRSSTHHFLRDRRDGRPWLSRLPFPVQVVDRVVVWDCIGRQRYTTRHAYHHGHWDGREREFRGFGMVEQWETECRDGPDWLVGLPLGDGDPGPVPDGVPDGGAAQLPPVLTRSWFHTGLWLGRDHVSDFFAGLGLPPGHGEYFREPGLTDAAARAMLLDDTAMPPGLGPDDERDACRALRGRLLREEVYALDDSPRAAVPYTVREAAHAVRSVQPRGAHRDAVFLALDRESLDIVYDRDAADPRVQHTLVLEVDAWGQVLKEAHVGYPRRGLLTSVDAMGHVGTLPNAALAALAPDDRLRQTTLLATFADHGYTGPIDTPGDWRVPMPCSVDRHELSGYAPVAPAPWLRASDLVEPDPAAPGRLRLRYTSEVPFESAPAGPRCRRCIGRDRTLYRRDDLNGLLPLGQQDALALTGESYRLALTPGLVAQVYRRRRPDASFEALLPIPGDVLAGTGPEQGGLLASQVGKADGRFPASDPDDHWWIPSGTTWFSPLPGDTPAAELARARQHFFSPQRFRDAFGQDTVVELDAADLLLVATVDALGSRSAIDRVDYRVLQAAQVSDANGNRSAYAFDALGMVTGTARMGKAGGPVEGDTLAGFAADVAPGDLDAFQDAADPHPLAGVLLQGASTRIVYDLDRFERSRLAAPTDPTAWLAPYAATLARETHVAGPLPPDGARIHIGWSFSDGFGREIQVKSDAEPLEAPGGGAPVPRWIVSGWVRHDAKGRPVRAYEPFFSDTHRFEFGVEHGVSPVLLYDPIGRVVATLLPDRTYDKTLFGAWRQVTYDQNDTVAPRNAQTGDPRTDPDVQALAAAWFDALPVDPAGPWSTWFQQRQAGGLGALEQAAAAKAAAHADTPTTAHLDVLGRAFLVVRHNRVQATGHPLDGSEQWPATRLELDIEGRALRSRDAIVEAGDPRGRVMLQSRYDLCGRPLLQQRMEGPSRWKVFDAQDQPIREWDRRGHAFWMAYDALRRPVARFVQGSSDDSDPRSLGARRQVEAIDYGEALAGAAALNLRLRIFRRRDAAGEVVNARLDAGGVPVEAFDFKGNLLCQTRRLRVDYRAIVDWSAAPALQAEAFVTRNRFDALDRAVQLVAPHADPARCQVLQTRFAADGEPTRVDVWLDRSAEPAGWIDPTLEAPSPVGVDAIAHDAKGQRQRIALRNGVTTTHEYDPATFRLARSRTRRDPLAFPGDTAPPPYGWPGSLVQNLAYTFDPSGNVTHVQDDAQQTLYFRNQRIEPSSDYTCDALYRLVDASGREHLGQGGAASPHSWNDAGRVGLGGTAAGGYAPDDLQAMGRYVERYVHDDAGNLRQMLHRGGGAATGWQRVFDVDEASAIEDGLDGALLKSGNRLSRSTLAPDGASPIVEPYAHDAHGNMLRMPQLGDGSSAPGLHWDYDDRLLWTDHGGGGTTWHVHDATGQRVRKVREKAPGLTEERLYLGATELFRRHPGAIGVDTATLERETVHVTDGAHRVALVEQRTRDTANIDTAPARLVRYQFGNHLDSSSLELDDLGRIVSYEEYAPFGSTTYQAVRSQTDTPKRYRYTGKERDEESGLYYHGARYYAPWLARWTAVDAHFDPEFGNGYAHVRGNPVVYVDPSGNEWTRFWGGVRAVGGAAQAIGGVVFAGGTAETGVGIAVGLGVAAHGLSDYEAGWRQMITGKPARSVAEVVIQAGLEKATVSKEHAQAWSTLIDAGLGLINPSGPVSSGPRLAFALAGGGQHAATALSVMSHAPAVAIVANGARTGNAILSTGGGGDGGGGAKPPAEPTPPKPTPKPPPAAAAAAPKAARAAGAAAEALRAPAASIAKNVANEAGGLTDLANKVKSIGQGKGATVEIVLARTKEGKDILVAGINSGAKGLTRAQLAQLKAWGINVAPEIAKGMKQGPHAEQNIAAFLQSIGARGVRWSQAVVGAMKSGPSGYVCAGCQDIIKLVGGHIEGH